MQINQRPTNPYYDYDAVRDLTMFFGRQDELRILYEAIEKRQCFSIVGSRHIGKSSLLKFIGMPEMQECIGYDLHDRIFILTDWREYRQKTREDFFHTVCEQIIAQSQPLVKLNMPSSSGEERFKKLLGEIRSAGYRPVLLMDAFDKVTKNPHFDPDFFSYLRSLAGIYDLISYVTATLKPLYEVCHSDAVATSPFFNIFQTFPLGPLLLEEARDLITLPAHRAGYDFSQEEVEWVLSQAGRHPFFVQVTCRYLFDEKLKNDGKADLVYVRQLIYNELEPHFDQLWEDLNEDEKGNLRLEAPSSNSRFRRKFAELSESGLFRKRLHALSQINAPTLALKDVKDALDNLDNNEFLEQSQLSKLHYVSLRAAGKSSVKRGLIVRESLKAALERMRGGGIRNDSASEWRLYNILWYHYFKYQLSNPQIQARLGIGSIRQFYREQEKAIQALLKELLEMETESFNEGTL